MRPVIASSVNAAVCLAALMGTATVLHESAPFPEVPQVKVKLRAFHAQPAHWNALVIGSSRVQQQISPDLFNALLDKAGYKVRLFNFGIDGMGLLETSFLLEKLLEERPIGLRWVFIELGEVTIDSTAEQKGTIREVYWHDLKRLTAIWEEATASTSSGEHAHLQSRLSAWLKQDGVRDPAFTFGEDLLNHLRAFAYNYANRGRVLEQVGRLGKPDVNLWLGPRRDGFTPKFSSIQPLEEARLRREVEQLRLQKLRPLPRSQTTIRLLQQIAARVERAGATPVFLGTPMAAKYPGYVESETDHPLVLYYDDPHLYPELYDPRFRLDHHHLNSEGAEVFTRTVARDFIRSLRTEH